MHPKEHKLLAAVAVVPSIGTNTSPFRESTAMECVLRPGVAPTNGIAVTNDWDASLMIAKIRLPEGSVPVTKKSPLAGSYQISSVKVTCGKVFRMLPFVS